MYVKHLAMNNYSIIHKAKWLLKVLLLPCPMETQLSPTSMVQQVKLISGQTNMNAISTGT